MIIDVIDSHTEGEPTRVVIAGGPDLGRGRQDEPPPADHRGAARLEVRGELGRLRDGVVVVGRRGDVPPRPAHSRLGIVGCRVGHLPQVAAIGSRDRDEILVATTRRAQDKHDVLTIGRPFRPTHQEAAGVGCQHDLTLPAAIRVDERESPLVVAGQNPLPVW